ncbi:hypothetical protein AAF712_011509 [Marasmius tenuissimus]|uniref:Transmembrane protein n=1 Tax=Marasmius tenuissimus TaxID=585030 RepID=A0ABR2ZK06_9AGAR|nr:hypothetical protein PM082_024389 [Marasmius tenuissimus]
MSNFDIQYPRRIIVDDKDPRITYEGVWNFDETTFVNGGTNGDPYNQSMTGTNSAQTSFTFTFEGDFVQVRGAKDNHKIPPPANSPQQDSLDLFPTYTCQVDNNSVKHVEYASFIGSTTNLVMCEEQLPKGRHTLTMNITVSVPEKQIFWLDSIEYSPVDTANLAEEVLKVDSSDIRSCFYSNTSNEWPWLQGFSVNMTRTPDARMTFKFNGTSVYLYGYNEAGATGVRFDSTTGSYSIDSGQVVSFGIPGSQVAPFNSTEMIVWSNQPFFKTLPVDGNTEHEMVISYSGLHAGTDARQFLSIDYFYVAHDGRKINGGSSGPGEQGSKSDHKIPVGVIAGGVLGGIFGLIAIGGLLWFLRRWRRRRGGPRELNNRRRKAEPSSTVSEVWTGEPLQSSRSPTGPRTTESTYGESSTANFTSMKRAQREVIDSQSRQERDSGFRYGTLQTAENSPGTALIPPAYTQE